MNALQKTGATIWFLYGLVVFSIFFSVADQPMSRSGLLPLNATAAALLSLAPFALITVFKSLAHGNLITALTVPLHNRSVLGAFAIVALSSILLSTLPGAFWEEGGKWIFLLTYGFVLTVFAQFIAHNSTISRFIPLYTFCALLLLCWSLWYDLTHPGTFSDPTNRSAGFPGNANYAALVAVMLCAASLRYSRGAPVVKDVGFLVLTGVFVIGTMSRSGLLNYAVLLSLYLYYRFVHGGIALREAVKFGVGIVASVTLVTAIALASGTQLVLFSQESRLSRFLRNEQVDDGSAASRLAAATDSLRLINEAPLLGHGTGHARTMAELPHNLYLQQWVNNGLAGLASYLLLLGSAYYTFLQRRCRQGQALIAVAITGSIFSHNVLDQRPFLILFGFLLGSSALHSIAATKAAQGARTKAALRQRQLAAHATSSASDTQRRVPRFSQLGVPAPDQRGRLW